jgi:UDP:flavonoid glycosyltransferase YjiC (YdhE family)
MTFRIGWIQKRLFKSFWKFTEQGPLVYAAFGTNVEFTPEQINIVHTFLANSGYSVLWSLRTSHPPPQARHVKVVPWAPQISVLRHPKVYGTSLLSDQKVALFVSHCGFNSAKESLLTGTPVLGVPFAMDQPIVASLLQSGGAGLSLSITELPGIDSKEVFDEIIGNIKYKQNAERIARLLVKVGYSFFVVAHSTGWRNQGECRTDKICHRRGNRPLNHLR